METTELAFRDTSYLLSWEGARYDIVELTVDRDKVYAKIRDFFA